jgi:hypothetical protein
MKKLLNKIYQKVFYFICINFYYSRVTDLYKNYENLNFKDVYYEFTSDINKGDKLIYIGNKKLFLTYGGNK